MRSQTAAAKYDFEFLKLHALYFHTRNQTTTKQQSDAFGATVPLDAFRVIGGVARVDNRYRDINSVLRRSP